MILDLFLRKTNGLGYIFRLFVVELSKYCVSYRESLKNLSNLRSYKNLYSSIVRPILVYDMIFMGSFIFDLTCYD